MNENRNHSVDLFRFLASLLIIAIHTGLFWEVNDYLNFFVVDIVCRLAVPFFAVCSGYFLTIFAKDRGRMRLSFKKQEKKLVVIYVVWSALYFFYDIPFAILGGYFTFKNYVGFVIAAVTTGTHYHLWYLLSLIYALPVFFFCVLRFNKRKTIFLIMTLLYTVKVISYGYIEWMPTEIQLISKTIQKFSALFDALFLILPFLLLGYLISRQKFLTRKWYAIGFMISFSLLTIEAFTLRSFGKSGVSFIFFTMPTIYFLFAVILKTELGNRFRAEIVKLLSSISTTIYCFHPMIIEVMPKEMFSVLRYLLVAIISIIVSSAQFYYMKKNMV